MARRGVDIGDVRAATLVPACLLLSRENVVAVLFVEIAEQVLCLWRSVGSTGTTAHGLPDELEELDVDEDDELELDELDLPEDELEELELEVALPDDELEELEVALPDDELELELEDFDPELEELSWRPSHRAEL